MIAEPIYPPAMLSVMPTWQCTAQCQDCGTFSSPKRKISLSLDEITAAIDRSAQENFAVVVFTGGEATLRWTELLTGIGRAKSLGLRTRLVTNGWWGRSQVNAATRMDALASAGLDEINFSTGDEHSRFVPLRSLAQALAAALDQGYKGTVMVELKADAVVSRSHLLQHEVMREIIGSRIEEVDFSESPWMPMDHEKVENYPEGQLANRHNLGSKTGCESIFRTHTLQANGVMAICCGLGMQSVPTLQTGQFQPETSFKRLAVENELDLTKLLIRQIGPERLLARLAELKPEIEWENLYAHKCQACLRVFSDPLVSSTIAENEDVLTLEFAVSLGLDRVLQGSDAFQPGVA